MTSLSSLHTVEEGRRIGQLSDRFNSPLTSTPACPLPPTPTAGQQSKPRRAENSPQTPAELPVAVVTPVQRDDVSRTDEDKSIIAWCVCVKSP